MARLIFEAPRHRVDREAPTIAPPSRRKAGDIPNSFPQLQRSTNVGGFEIVRALPHPLRWRGRRLRSGFPTSNGDP